MKICFLGTPDYTLPVVKKLYEQGFLRAIVSKPEKFAGRGLEKRNSLLKDFAFEHHLTYVETENINECEEFFQLDIDYVFVFSFSQFLGERVLKTYPCVNLHLSLLPQFRGASPVHYVLWQGLKKTGWTLQKIVKKMDAGDILFQGEVFIEEKDFFSSLLEKIIHHFLQEGLDQFLVNPFIKGRKQDESLVSFAPVIKKEQGEIFLQKQSAIQIFNQYKAFLTWPGIFLRTSQGLLKITKCSLNHEHQDDLALETLKGKIYIHQVVPAGKKPMSPGAYLRGLKLDLSRLLLV